MEPRRVRAPRGRVPALLPHPARHQVAPRRRRGGLAPVHRLGHLRGSPRRRSGQRPGREERRGPGPQRGGRAERRWCSSGAGGEVHSGVAAFRPGPAPAGSQHHRAAGGPGPATHRLGAAFGGPGGAWAAGRGGASPSGPPCPCQPELELLVLGQLLPGGHQPRGPARPRPRRGRHRPPQRPEPVRRRLRARGRAGPGRPGHGDGRGVRGPPPCPCPPGTSQAFCLEPDPNGPNAAKSRVRGAGRGRSLGGARVDAGTLEKFV